jgi:hypothetical protein
LLAPAPSICRLCPRPPLLDLVEVYTPGTNKDSNEKMTALDEIPPFMEGLGTNLNVIPSNTSNTCQEGNDPVSDFHYQPRVRARRRSSCSALPSTTIMELNDLAESSSRSPREGLSRKESLGSFLRFNNSFHSSVTSLSDSSDCAKSGEKSELDVDDNQGEQDMEEFARMAGADIMVDDVQPNMQDSNNGPDIDPEHMDRIKKKKKKKSKDHKDHKEEKPSRRRMQRRSSWSGAVPQEASPPPVTHDDTTEYRCVPSLMMPTHVPLEVTSQTNPDEPLPEHDQEEPKPTRRRMNRRSSWHASSTSHQDDGVISSFKTSTTAGSTVMFEEQFEYNTTVTLSPQADHMGTDDERQQPVEQPTTATRRTGRANRRASWGGSAGYDHPPSSPVVANDNSNKYTNSMDTTPPNSPSVSTNAVVERTGSVEDTSKTEERQEQQHGFSGSIHDLPVKEVKRTLLMVKHVQSGAARARRRASWTASTVNYLDDAPSLPEKSPQQLIAEVFSSLKKNAQDTEDENDGFVQSAKQDTPMDLFDETEPLPPPFVEYRLEMSPDGGATTSSQRINTHVATTDRPRRMERRSSWHTSSVGYGESSSTLDTRMSQASQKSQSSQTFVMDLNKPNKSWKAKEVHEDEACEVSQDRPTRSWKLGKTKQSDRSRSPDLVVVSSANMPQRDRPSLSSDQGISCIQLTAFGDVTTIDCDF